MGLMRGTLDAPTSGGLPDSPPAGPAGGAAAVVVGDGGVGGVALKRHGCPVRSRSARG